MSDFDEFAEVVGTKKLPEYTLVRIKHPWGMYTKEVIRPDGTKIPNDEKNKKEIREINVLVGQKKAKYKINEYTLSRPMCVALAKRDRKMDEVLWHCMPGHQKLRGN